MQILVTGINGFVGKHLARELASRDIEVIGVGHQEPTVNEEIAGIVSQYFQCDVTKPDAVDLLPLENLNAVINLAGLASVGASFKNPELYMNVNVNVLSVLGGALLNKNPRARMIAVSTGGIYESNQLLPLTETSQTVENGSPYAKSKLAMEEAARELRKNGQDCVVVRPFNHIGPGQGLGFLIPDLADKLKRADPANPQITAGNLRTIRDFTDVRDIAKAYTDLATSEVLEYDLYNVCSGSGQSGEDIVKALCSSLNINFAELTINTDPSLIRPTDPPKIIGDSSRLQEDTGWEPEIPLSKTVEDIVAELNS